MKRTVLVFGLLVIAIAVLFQLSKYVFVSSTSSFEIVLSLIAATFLVIGLTISRKYTATSDNSLNEINGDKINELKLSQREYEVLLKIASGQSNKEIADDLFLSESTVKTHVSNLFSKLNSKRRTQAVEVARNLKII